MSEVIKVQGRHPLRGLIISVPYACIEDAWERMKTAIADGYDAYVTINGERTEIN